MFFVWFDLINLYIVGIVGIILIFSFWIYPSKNENPQNGQIHSNNSSAIDDEFFWVRLIILWTWHLKD